jgi:hypothetical protein
MQTKKELLIPYEEDVKTLIEKLRNLQYLDTTTSIEYKMDILCFVYPTIPRKRLLELLLM